MRSGPKQINLHFCQTFVPCFHFFGLILLIFFSSSFSLSFSIVICFPLWHFYLYRHHIFQFLCFYLFKKKKKSSSRVLQLFGLCFVFAYLGLQNARPGPMLLSLFQQLITNNNYSPCRWIIDRTSLLTVYLSNFFNNNFSHQLPSHCTCYLLANLLYPISVEIFFPRSFVVFLWCCCFVYFVLGQQIVTFITLKKVTNLVLRAIVSSHLKTLVLGVTSEKVFIKIGLTHFDD